MNKVLVIGMDGATFDLIDPWIKEGKLPVLERCIKQGTRSPLLSTPLSNSAQAWSSFITGKNPGKHGIYDFFETLPDSYGVRFLNASFRSGKSIWRLVSEAGKKVGIINVPITYPAEEVNGFLIPGLDSPGTEGNFAYPRGLMEEINEHSGEYIVEAGIWGYIRRGKPDIALEKLLEMTEPAPKEKAPIKMEPPVKSKGSDEVKGREPKKAHKELENKLAVRTLKQKIKRVNKDSNYLLMVLNQINSKES